MKKHSIAIVILLLAIIITTTLADEASSSAKIQQQNINNSNNVPLSSSSTNDLKQQNKRLAYHAPPDTLSSGFKPITSSYPTVSNFVSSHHHQHQPYASAVNNNYVKYSQQQFVTPSNVKYSLSSAPYNHNRGSTGLSYGYNNFYSYPQQLAFAASQPAAVSYTQSPYHLAQQYFAHQLPLTNYNVHQVTPLIHSPNIGFLNTYNHHHPQQAPANAYHQYSINKIPQYPTYYNQHQPQTSPKQQQQQQQSVITSKPVALETPLATSSSSSLTSGANEVHHNQHGAVSYSAFKVPSAAALIATPSPPQHVIYPPLDYGKNHVNAYSLHSHPLPPVNHFAGYSAVPNVNIQPYARISPIAIFPTPVVPTQVLSVSVVPTIPQKISLH
ncbi:hypothetical protein PVAND_011036 [Polypedilum vanderplanki]|uniref:Uncharacterized protein n=1 Tax=Polypedilum vanderplanki TaxID=319348 RepID=A0A9J6CHW8_POLVA|nr:hypothetical protein PVAND_011036 [Polypedilum vanderplanki]